MPLTTSYTFPPPSLEEFTRYSSRRSVVHSIEGIVACTQPIAAKCGLEILRAGGNAADAAVAVAAGLNMTEPCSTGIGGDMFILFYNASTKKIHALNGSGRSGAQSTLEQVRQSLGLAADGKRNSIPMDSVHAVTVPGAAAGWIDTVEKFGSGKVTMAQVLEPAIRLGEKGFPVSEIAAASWQRSEHLLRAASPNYAEMLKSDPAAPDGVRAPRAGEVLRNPYLARTFRRLAKNGKKGFYCGQVAEELVKVVQSRGGLLRLEDLEHHLVTGSQEVDPISLKFDGFGLGKEPKNGGNGLEVWEHPPNGQGIVALMALGIIQEMEKQGKIPKFTAEDFNSTEYLHAIIEALRLAFADANWYVTDPAMSAVPSSGLISSEYLADRAKLFDPRSAIKDPECGEPVTSDRAYPSPALHSSDTVYLTVTDSFGNAASLINSNFGGFGSSIVPRQCGFTLQNRGANFSLDSSHPNRLEPRKRPYHTIIPAMVTNAVDGSLYMSFGVMGGFMQPQGHVQVLLAQVVGGLDPQRALDAPRICIGPGMGKPGESETEDKDLNQVNGDNSSGSETSKWVIHVEEGIEEDTVQGLRELGHLVKVVSGWEREMFGRGQVVRYAVDAVDGTPVWSGGSDMRGDGAAYPL